jgi:hypothetical protein
MKEKEISKYSKNKLVNFSYLIIIAMPVLTVAYLINKFAVNVPYWDDWHIATFLIKYYDGTLHFLDFYVQNNEHRPVFTLMINFIIGLLTNYNVICEIYVSFFLIVGLLLLFYLVYKSEFDNNNLLFFIPISFILFSLRQYTNFLWGFENCVYLSIFGFILMIFFLNYYKSYKTLLFAIVSGIVATFSFFVILIIWPIGLISILLSNRNKNQILVWLISSGLVYFFYFWNWKKSNQTASLFNFNSIQDVVGYFFVLIGSPLASDWISAMGIGILLSIISLTVLHCIYSSKNVRNFNFEICTLLFAVSFSITNAIGRSAWGISYAFMSRYTPFNLLIPISLYLILLKLLYQNVKIVYIKNPGYILTALSTIVIFGLIAGNMQGLLEMESGNPQSLPNDNLIKDQYYLLSYKYQPDDNLKYIHPSPEYLRQTIPQIEKHRLGVFNDVPYDNYTISNQSTYCSIDKIASVPIINNVANVNSAGKSITVEGWAIDSVYNKKAMAVYVSIDNTYDIPAMYCYEREDVANYFNNPGLKYSGFWASFASSLLTQGSHSIRLKIISINGKEIYFSQPVTITITAK